MKKLLLITLLFIFGCAGHAKESVQDGDFKIELLFEKDGCKMYRFKDGGNYIYWSDCSGKTSYEHTVLIGKTIYTVSKQSITTNK